MQWLSVVCALITAVYGGGGVTKTSGITKFWTDDYNVFDQVYGKTSDRDLYGSTIPPTYSYGGTEPKKQASEKKERFIESEVLAEPELNFAKFGNRYANFITQQYGKTKTKPSFNFIGASDFKPISQKTDPETYNYLKHLEQLNNKPKIEFPETVGGFKPYLSYGGSNPEETEAYKSIQDILDAHEANKSTKNEDKVKYLNYGPTKGKKKLNAGFKGNDFKSRCRSGRCRKRGITRVRTRPYLRAVKHRIVGY